MLRTIFIWSIQLMPTVHLKSGCQFMSSALAKTSPPLFTMSGCHSLLVHAAAKSFNVVTDISDHSVPFISLRGLLAFVWGCAVTTSSCCSIAVGCGIRGRAGRTAIAAKAVCDDSSAIFDTNGLKEILKVLAVLLWYEGTQTYRSKEKTWSIVTCLFST